MRASVSVSIAIEAALYAYNIAPGFGRHFALENLAFFDAARALEIRKQEAAKIRTDVLARITGTDKDPEAVKRARKNAEHACVAAGRAKYCKFLKTTKKEAVGKSIFKFIPNSKMLDIVENRYTEESVIHTYEEGTTEETKVIVTQ